MKFPIYRKIKNIPNHQSDELTVNQWEYITDIMGRCKQKYIYNISLSEDGLYTPKL
jgi:hypothetical protein